MRRSSTTACSAKWRRRIAIAAPLALTVVPGLALAQAGTSGAAQRVNAASSWTTDVGYLSVNAALAGLTAGLIQTARAGSFWDAFKKGALGGGVSYAGRHVAARRFDGAGLLGREVAAVGASFVRNAAGGGGLLDELVLPVGIARVYIRRDDSSPLGPVRVKLDVPTIIATTYFGLRRDTDFDLGASLSAGTPVFYARDRRADDGWSGAQAGAAVRLRGNPADPHPEADERAVLSHELVHVLQYDLLSFGIPVDDPLTRRLPGGGWIDRHLDLDLHVVAWPLANLLIPYDQRPWELEAQHLSRTSSHRW